MPAHRLLLFLLFSVAGAAAGACSAPGASDPPNHSSTVRPTTEASSAGLGGTRGCRQPLDVDDPVDALAAAVDEFSVAIDADGAETGCVVVTRPVCAALFLIGATDPIAALGVGLSIDDIDRLAELHQRVLVGGVEAAKQHEDVELGAALQAMIDLDVRAAVSGDAAEIAVVAVARTDPAIVGPIASAESYCR